jgi:hypothetical protein
VRLTPARLDDLEDEFGETPLMLPGRVGRLKLCEQRPFPVLDDVAATGAQERKQRLEARPGRSVVMRGVVDDDIERARKLRGDDSLERRAIGLVDAPVRREACL